MATILVEKLCACAKKRKSWAESIECDSIEEATQKASTMCEQGNTKFCKKHTFSYTLDGENVLIKMDVNK
ncbi:hypothetical protein [Arcobacter sp. FWKO B]|uniref:hypothetical protein n=1 Tax=Arcobacter sp. FWKO B TaxID=2593672 RepID=UPI0018A531A3|nr:hypothetical protein [Arcobacter sp. FWKO B]QOG13120.1 hypothetical protein FWKOB_10665 [Arcobacter sp. FWKO B]